MRGGARKGAGGKKPRLPEGKKKIPLSTRLSPDVVEWLRAHDQPIAQIIERLARQEMESDT